MVISYQNMNFGKIVKESTGMKDGQLKVKLNKIMEKLCYIRVAFKKAVKKDYPIYYKQPYPIKIHQR